MKSKLEYAPLALLCIYTTKLLILNTWGFESAAVLIGLSAVCCVFQIKAKNDQVEEIHKKLDAQVKETELLKQQNEQIRSSIASLRMSAVSKPTQMKF